MKNKITLAALLVLFTVAFSMSQTGFTGKPTYQIITKRAGVYLGTVNVELFPNIAPHHVRNFDSLVSVHFYDTTAFHRVVPGFVIQGGDPNTRHGAMSTWGYGQPNQPTVNAEFSPAKHVRGMLSAARSNNINSATSQFFICVATAANLNGQYSLYGKVTSGMNIVDTIVNAPCNPAPYTSTPLQKIEMFITRTGSNDSVPHAPALVTPVNGTVGIDSNTAQLKWSAVSDAILYHVEVATDSLFNDTLLSRDVAALFYYASGFAGNTNYYWHVNVNNGGHYSDYSPTWRFHTKGETTGIATNSGSEPMRVFPNPATGKFNFSNIERGSKIEIFDYNGKLVFDTMATDTSVMIDLTRKDKGEYFYKITDSKKQFQKGKLILQ